MWSGRDFCKASHRSRQKPRLPIDQGAHTLPGRSAMSPQPTQQTKSIASVKAQDHKSEETNLIGQCFLCAEQETEYTAVLERFNNVPEHYNG